ncbi:MAG: hypothetical protein ACREC3_06880 [Methyloceanibacter sp.]
MSISDPSRFSSHSRPTVASLPAVETHCFAVRAAATPGMMSRVLELFAKRNLVPTKWHSAVIGAAQDELQIDLQMESIDGELAGYIARCLRQIYGIDSVLTSTKTAG